MATISTANFLIETKRIAHMIALIQTAFGDGDDANTPGKGAASALTAIAALGDNDQLNALLPAAVRFAAAAVYQNYYYKAMYDFLRAMDEHVGGINDYLSDNSLYVNYLTRLAYPKILVAYTFPPVTDFGSMAVSGAATGTWTAEDTVDTSLYGDAQIEIVTESLIGAADIVLTISGTDHDGNTSQATCTIPATTANDTTVDVDGAATADRFAAVDADPTFTGGTASDAFRIQTKLDRAASGCA